MNSLANIVYKPYAILLAPIQNSLLELLHLIGSNFKIVAKFLSVILLAFVLFSSLGYYQLAIRYVTWVLLGVASSIGFGFGMHTFVLFLAPHIAAVTMAALSCNSLNFPEPPYPNEIICPDQIDNYEITYLRILQKIGVESFMWGLGTAIGELPPYLAARLRAQAMSRQRAGGDELGLDSETADWEVWMIRIIHKVGFIGILLCAAIPNPLFDAAGVASGVAQVPFLSFFGATFIGKAIIKVFIQSSFVIISFHNNNLDSLIQTVDKRLCDLFPSFKDLNLNKTLTKILEEQRNNFLTKKLGEPKQASLLSTIFGWLTCACFALFILSLINALDKQYRERNKLIASRRTE